MAASRAKRPFGRATVLAAVQSALLVSMAEATDHTWNNAAGGSYATGTNWTPNSSAGGPGSLDRSIFNLNNTYAVTFDANVENAGFQQTQGEVIFNLGSGRSYTLTSSDFELGNTAGQSAILSVTSGTFVINAPTSGIGTVADSGGYLVISGAGTSFNTLGYCDVGIAGFGRIWVDSGASASIGGGSWVASSPGSVGVIVAHGAGTTVNLGASHYIGRVGTGFLDAGLGATLNVGPGLFLGWDALAEGIFTIGASGSAATTVNSSGMTVGYSGTGALSLDAGGSTLNNAGDVNLAYNAGAIATAVVGTASTWNQSGGSIYVGGYSAAAGGQANLDVAGGTLAVTGTGNSVVIRGSGIGANNGTLNLSSGLLSTPNFTRDPNGIFNFTGGTLQINGGTLNLNQTTYVLNAAGAGATLIFNGAGSSFATASTNLTVGSTNNGALRVLGGAQPALATVRAGLNATGTGTILVSGTGSTLSTSGICFIGTEGNASLTVESGGRYLGNADLHVATNVGNSTMTVTGPGSELVCRTLTLGQFSSGKGTVNLSNGASLSALQVFVGTVGGSGNLNVSGSGTSLVLSGGGLHPIVVGNTDALPSTATFGFGAMINADTLEVRSGSTVNLNGATLNLFHGFTPGGGTFNFNGGTLGFTTGWVADVTQINAVLGSSATLGVGRTIQTGITAPVTLQSPLTLDGGTLNAGILTTNGYLNFVSGTLGIQDYGGLAVGNAGALGPNVTLNAAQTLNVNAMTTIDAGGLLIVQNGRLNSGVGLTNNGEVQLDGANARITGGAVTNNKLILGEGRISGNLTNNASGELRAAGSQRLVLGGSTNTNSGQITLLNGGTVEFLGGLTNNAAGVISGRGALITGTALNNTGQVQLSGGASDIFGQVNNNNGGKVIVSGGATASFYDAVANNAGAELRVATGSTAVFFGPVTGSGAFTGSGTKIFESSAPSNLAAIASITGDTIVDGAAGVWAGVVREDSLEVDGLLTVVPNGTAAATSRVNTLLIPPGGRLDLTDNKLIVAAADVGSWNGLVYTHISGLVDAGRGNASNAQWNGSGIVTSDTRAVNNNDLCSVGVALASQVKGIASTATTTFAGQTVQGDDVVVMFTWGGDANLDGKINIDDYGQIDFNVSSSGSVFGWYNGDFNYDGKINIDDYGIIDFNVSAQDSVFPTGGSIGGLDSVSAVPEPAVLACPALAALAFCSRHRRRRS